MRPRRRQLGFVVVCLALAPGTATASWTVPVALTPAGAGYSAPAVAVSATGGALAAWVSAPSRRAGDPGRVEVAQRLGAGARWGAPRRLSGTRASAPAVAVNARGDALVAWIAGRTVVAATRGPRGPWSRAVAVRAAGGVQELVVAVGPTGRSTLMWSERAGAGFVVALAARTSARAGWVRLPGRLATGGLTPPELALSPGAGALVAWSADGALWASRTRAGTFERPQELATGVLGAPAAALSRRGAGLVAWAVALPGGTPVIGAATRSGAESGWGAAQDLGIGREPRAALGDGGDAAVAWSLAAAGAPQGIESSTRRRGGPWRAGTIVGRRDCSCALGVGAAAVAHDGTVLVSWRRDDGATRGVGGVAWAVAGSDTWRAAAFGSGDALSAPAVAGGAGRGGLAAWVRGGAAGGVRVTGPRVAVTQGTLARAGRAASIPLR